jgi:hypothetical protein
MADPDRRADAEGFFSAWSRRKRAARLEEARAATEPDLDPDAVAAEASEAQEPEADAVDETYIAQLPSLEEITGDTDLGPFMKRGVPRSMRNAAMRKVWLANTLIRNHDDPAVDYAWDWNAPEGVPGAHGTISQESISKMVKSLTTRAERAPVEDFDLAEAAAPGPEDAEAAGARTEVAPPPEEGPEPEPMPSPVRRTEAPAPAAEKTPAQNAAQPGPASTEVVASARRHGSALPQ